MSIRNQKKIIILLAVFTIIVVVFNKSYALFQTTAISDKPVVQITTGDKLPKPSTGVGKELLKYDIEAKKETCNPIIEEDGIIYLSGNDVCIDFNYVWYSGKLWRITAIYSDGTMKMITQNPISVINWESNKTYKDSGIYQWLNEDFKDTLYNYENIIVQNADWNATRDTDESEIIVQGAVGLLNSHEHNLGYENSSFEDIRSSYLKNEFWWVLPRNYANTNGFVNVHYGDISHLDYGARPSVILKSDIELRGEGTKSNPYTITIDKATGTKGEPINTRLSGEYVKVDNKVYRIVGIENNTTKLTSVDYVRNDDTVFKPFGSNTSWATSVASGEEKDENGEEKYWGAYLNNTWLTENLKQYITNGTYYLGEVGNNVSYKNSICSASNTKETTKDCEKTTSTWTEGLVGLPRVGEMFSAQLGEGYSSSNAIWLITPYLGSRVWYFSSAGTLNYSSPSDGRGVRPSINLKSEVKIAGGRGTESSPYEVTY